MKQFLFAYGTLRNGFAPPEIVETAQKLIFMGEGFVHGKVQDFGKYPVFQLGGKEKVFGHVFEMPDDNEVLQKLDEYEGYLPETQSESLFLRKETTVFLNEAEIKCWVYEFNWEK